MPRITRIEEGVEEKGKHGDTESTELHGEIGIATNYTNFHELNQYHVKYVMFFTRDPHQVTQCGV